MLLRLAEKAFRPGGFPIREGRVVPISNWTELDVWQYIAEEDLEVSL